MADTSRQVILWTAGAAGVMLIYSAYKNQSPLSEFKSWLGSGSASGGTGTGAGLPSSAPGSDPGTATNTGDLPSTQEAIANQDEINNVLSGQASQYSVSTDDSGIAYVYDQNGNVVSEVPSAYQHSPGTYIPPRNVAGSAY